MDFFKREHRIFNLTDRITILYIIVSGIMLFFGNRNTDEILLHLFIRLFIFFLIYLTAKNCNKHEWKVLKLIHRFYPLLLLSFFFPETYYLNNIFDYNLDPFLLKYEIAIFGFSPAETFSSCCPWPWFSEAMHIGYFSFYPLIASYMYYYYYKRYELAENRVFLLFFSFYVFYLIFILFPSEGPQYFIKSTSAETPDGYLFTNFMKMILKYGDRPTGAFPSSHIGITWIIMYFFFKDSPGLFRAWLIPALLLTFSTVYIKAHYAIDVLGGLMMVPLLITTGGFLLRHLASGGKKSEAFNN
ncbi:MAG: phosphatase PAP2 family protein [Chlorobi bacterium]|nr:phosphatase PAP2 family protein [Chlorobiota bacterium]